MEHAHRQPDRSSWSVELEHAQPPREEAVARAVAELRVDYDVA